MSTRRLICPCGVAWDHPVSAPVPENVRLICPVCSLAPTNDADIPRGATAEGLKAHCEPAASSSENAAAVGPGSVIAGYEILEEINRGGMGVIYKARQPGVNRLVALKIISPAKLNQPGTRGRFKREVRASGRMNDPCIVTIYQTELDGPIPFVAMEYVPGIDLLRLVKQTGPLPVDDVVYYARQILDGLQHAYEAKLVHRDIKPSNLMISPSPLAPTAGHSGKLPKVKILDMGLARLLDSEPDPEIDDLTPPGVFVGTPDYVAPEQAENPRAADIRSDLYSLGATMYFCLTGEVPFPGKTLAAKLRKQLTEPPPSAAARRSDVPVAVDAFIRKLMALEPADRYQTPAEAIAALDAVRKSPLPKPGTKTAPAMPSVFAQAHDGGVQAMVVAPDGAALITGGGDSCLRFWHPATLKQLRTISGDVGVVETMALAPSGKWLATSAIRLNASDMGVQLWDLATGQERKRLHGPTDNIYGVAISPDGQAIAAGSADKIVWLWLRDASGPTTACVRGHTATVSAVAFVAADSLLSASHDGTVRQWDLKTGKTKGQLLGGVGPIYALAYAAKRVVVAGRDGLAWRAPGATSFHKLRGHDGPVLCCALSPDGQFIASGGADGTVGIYRAEDGLALAHYPGHQRPVRAVAFAVRGDAVYSGSEDGTLRRWPVPKTL
ncbi:MAG: serine/threonine-protein kinase [Gemmataceae bacterium]|nr:serine/threonine protein kinase [Gemmata sp.]MDW8199442.1 serine/threonine-protein kinase [Gemmataceae bacterium]